MEGKLNPWQTYHENTKERPPRESLQRALALVEERNTALDLGAGALTDTKYLIQEGFEKIVVVDSEPSIGQRSTEINNDRLEVVISKFEDFNFSPNTYDLINAQFSLPFTHPEQFIEVFERLKDSLKQRGVFVGQLFGDRDGWASDSNMTFHTSDQVKELLDGLEVMEFKEEEKDGTTAAGEQKHWHVFHLLARK